MALSATATVSGTTATVDVTCDAGRTVRVQAGIACVGVGSVGTTDTSQGSAWATTQATMPSGLTAGDFLIVQQTGHSSGGKTSTLQVRAVSGSLSAQANPWGGASRRVTVYHASGLTITPSTSTPGASVGAVSHPNSPTTGQFDVTLPQGGATVSVSDGSRSVTIAIPSWMDWPPYYGRNAREIQFGNGAFDRTNPLDPPQDGWTLPPRIGRYTGVESLAGVDAVGVLVSGWRGVDPATPIEAVSDTKWINDEPQNVLLPADWNQLVTLTPGAVVLAMRDMDDHPDGILYDGSQIAEAYGWAVAPPGFEEIAQFKHGDRTNTIGTVALFRKTIPTPGAVGPFTDQSWSVWGGEGHFGNGCQLIALRPAPGVGYGTVGAVSSPTSTTRRAVVTDLAPQTVLTISDGGEVLSLVVAASGGLSLVVAASGGLSLVVAASGGLSRTITITRPEGAVVTPSSPTATFGAVSYPTSTTAEVEVTLQPGANEVTISASTGESVTLIVQGAQVATARRSAVVAPRWNEATARRSGAATLRRSVRLRFVATYGGQTATATEDVVLDRYTQELRRAATVKPVGVAAARRSGMAEGKALKTARRSSSAKPQAASTARRAGIAPLSPASTLRLRFVATYGGESTTSSVTVYTSGSSATGRRAGRVQPATTASSRRSSTATGNTASAARRSSRTTPATPVVGVRRSSTVQAQAAGKARRSAKVQPQAAGTARRSATASGKAVGTVRRSGVAQAQAQGLQRRSATTTPNYVLTTGADRRASSATPSVVTGRRAGAAQPTKVTERRASTATPQQTLRAQRAGAALPQAAGADRRSGTAEGRVETARRRAGVATASPPPPTSSTDRRSATPGQLRKVNWSSRTQLVASETTRLVATAPTRIVEDKMQDGFLIKLPRATNFTHVLEFYEKDGRTPRDVSQFDVSLVVDAEGSLDGLTVPASVGSETHLRILEFTKEQLVPMNRTARVLIDKGGAAGPEDAASGTFKVT